MPEFTDDASVVSDNQEAAPVKEAAPEKDTPVAPTEKPADETIVGEDIDAPLDPEVQKLTKAVEKLQTERTQLIKEVKDLRGSKREIKQEKLRQVEQHIDDLKDLHPEDVSTIDRVLRSKGYVTKEEAGQMFYDAVKNEELEKFLSKYPEYKPENDPDNIRWGAFERQIEKEKELGYALPKNPHYIATFLERVHGAITPKGNTDQAAVQRRIQIAGVGSGGSQQSSSAKRLDSSRREILVRGGWSEDEIKKIEAKLPD